jgi:hypothetical protein
MATYIGPNAKVYQAPVFEIYFCEGWFVSGLESESTWLLNQGGTLPTEAKLIAEAKFKLRNQYNLKGDIDVVIKESAFKSATSYMNERGWVCA